MTDSKESKWSARMGTALRRIAQPITVPGSVGEAHSIRKTIPASRITTSALAVESSVLAAAVGIYHGRNSPPIADQPITIPGSDKDDETISVRKTTPAIHAISSAPAAEWPFGAAVFMHRGRSSPPVTAQQVPDVDPIPAAQPIRAARTTAWSLLSAAADPIRAAWSAAQPTPDTDPIPATRANVWSIRATESTAQQIPDDTQPILVPRTTHWSSRTARSTSPSIPGDSRPIPAPRAAWPTRAAPHNPDDAQPRPDARSAAWPVFTAQPITIPGSDLVNEIRSFRRSTPGNPIGTSALALAATKPSPIAESPALGTVKDLGPMQTIPGPTEGQSTGAAEEQSKSTRSVRPPVLDPSKIPGTFARSSREEIRSPRSALAFDVNGPFNASGQEALSADSSPAVAESKGI